MKEIAVIGAGMGSLGQLTLEAAEKNRTGGLYHRLGTAAAHGCPLG